MIDRPVLALTLQILFLSCVAVGGFVTVLPDLDRFVVDERSWMTRPDFVTLYALAQAAPGPNFIVVTLVGWRVGGATGAILATLATCLPTLLIAYSASRAWRRFNEAGWYKVFERGVGPFTVGLILASGLLLASGAATGPAALALTAASAAFMLLLKKSPLIPLAFAAIIGAVGLV